MDFFLISLFLRIHQSSSHLYHWVHNIYKINCFIVSTSHCRRYSPSPSRRRRCSSSTHCHHPYPRGSNFCRGYRSARGSTDWRESRTGPDNGRLPKVTAASGQKTSSLCLDYNRVNKHFFKNWNYRSIINEIEKKAQ